MGSRSSSTETASGSRVNIGRIFLIMLALAVIVPGLQRVIDSIGSFGVSANNDGIVTDVVSPFRSTVSSPTAPAGLVPGDRIDLQAGSLELPTGVEAPCLSVPVHSGIPEATTVFLPGPHDTGNDIEADERDMLKKLAARAATNYERVVAGLLREEVAQLRGEVAALRNKAAPANL